MKLFRFGSVGSEKPGVVLSGDTWVDVSAFGADYNEAFFEGGGLARLEAWVKQNGASCPRVDTSKVRLASPICRPSKIICVGLNYHAHAVETNMPIPAEPVLFFKSTTALVGPNDDLKIPRGAEKTDWEVELAVIIGKTARYVEKSSAMQYVAGYALHNDYSERAFQLERGGQWVKGKSCDTFAPLGPMLVTRDEIDPSNLRLWLKLNGKMVQDSNTSDMIFDVPTIVSYISQFMTLLPGDVISTGTPQGVGLGLKPPTFLKVGDTVELGIDGLGTSQQRAVACD
ncbi:MAG: fumarylacetoacetate hydrolase family protein [Polyangiaceae bacterium]|nr:fumarylacetoacetate hydrolase family protein [Polyangiaceae bacterium]